MTRAGESKFFYSRFSLDGVVCTALQGSLTPEGLLYFYEARTRVGKLECVADDVGKATNAATSLITLVTGGKITVALFRGGGSE